MWEIYKKELAQFLNSLIAYLVISVFLTGVGLLTWVFPETSVLDFGFADLSTLFSFGPFVLMFLVPAITMRMIAEERKTGTLEFLLTKPLTEWQIVLGKYFAALSLVVFSILPTLVYYYSLYQLGNPQGNLDTPGIIGSYLGLILLGAVFTAIGLAASSMSSNTIVGFIFAVFLCFFFYSGVSEIAALFKGDIALYIEDVSLSYHYNALSRGLIDTRDITFFISTIVFVLIIAHWQVIARKLAFRPLRSRLIRNIVLGMLVLLLLNIWAANFFTRIDITEDQRYTLKPATKAMLRQIDAPLQVEILLDGDLPAGFERLKQAIQETLLEFDVYTQASISYTFRDPGEAEDVSGRNKNYDALIQQGFNPTQVFDTEKGKQIKKLIFPYAIIRYKEQAAGILLLKGAQGSTAQERLNQSIEGIEFELAVGIQRLARINRKNIGLVTGHNELDSMDVVGFLSEMVQYFDLEAVKLGISSDLKKFDALIVAKPTEPLTKTDLYILDQYIMYGGDVIFLVDALQVDMNQAGGAGTLATPINHNLSEMLFRYGIRLNNNLIQDIQNFGRYPVVVGEDAQLINLPWPFYAGLYDFSEHPITRNLDGVYARFFGTMDTVKAEGIQKTPLMFTSPRTRVLSSPAPVAFEDYANEPADELFTHGKEPIAYLLEGRFTSMFRNRVLPEGVNANAFFEDGLPAKVLVVSDGDIIRNEKNLNTGTPFELGFNPFAEQGEKRSYANKEFLFNALAYMTNENGLITSRTKEVKLRPLNRVKVRQERITWQLINLVAPLFVIICFGLLRFYWRRAKYTRNP